MTRRWRAIAWRNAVVRGVVRAVFSRCGRPWHLCGAGMDGAKHSAPETGGPDQEQERQETQVAQALQHGRKLAALLCCRKRTLALPGRSLRHA
jgi:hypothetical protein